MPAPPATAASCHVIPACCTASLITCMAFDSPPDVQKCISSRVGSWAWAAPRSRWPGQHRQSTHQLALVSHFAPP